MKKFGFGVESLTCLQTSLLGWLAFGRYDVEAGQTSNTVAGRNPASVFRCHPSLPNLSLNIDVKQLSNKACVRMDEILHHACASSTLTLEGESEPVSMSCSSCCGSCRILSTHRSASLYDETIRTAEPVLSFEAPTPNLSP